MHSSLQQHASEVFWILSHPATSSTIRWTLVTTIWLPCGSNKQWLLHTVIV
jgi:hypothetical protein